MNEYPRWRHHATQPMRLVQNPLEDEALGEGWADTPAAFDAAPEQALTFGAGAEPVPVPDQSATGKKGRKGR